MKVSNKIYLNKSEKNFKLDISIQEINKADSGGNSPLLLAVKMAHKNEEFQNVIKNILRAGGNPKIKDINGWTPLDEAVTQV